MNFPFGAIVGQDDLKKAILVSLVNPLVNGVLIEGEKGTGKSSIVRSIYDILPDIEVFEGCLFNLGPKDEYYCKGCSFCSCKKKKIKRRPFVLTLPLNVTEDMVVGGIDFEKTLRSGMVSFQPGILARANGGVLYIDEINLLPDHIVDIILDVLESRVNIVEREGISVTHPTKFTLIASMNPEEGDLRPQLKDRFGLCVKVKGLRDPKQRVETVLRREGFDRNPIRFFDSFSPLNKKYMNQITKAKSILPRVRISNKLRILISNLCVEQNCAGHRADIILEQAAKADAALNFKEEVEEGHIMEMAPYVLEHRKRMATNKQEQKKSPQKKNNESKSRNNKEERHKSKTHKHKNQTSTDNEHIKPEMKTRDHIKTKNGELLEKIFKIGETFKPKKLLPFKDRRFRTGSGKRATSKTRARAGRYVSAKMKSYKNDIALDATIRAAAPYQLERKTKSEKNLAIIINKEDVREKIREKKIGTLILFLVDASGSMGAMARMSAAKGAIMSLLLDAYQKRDKVAMITFNRDRGRLILPPTNSVELAGKYLSDLPVGGRTPLSSGLYETFRFLTFQNIKDPTLKKIVILITDGRANVSLGYFDDPIKETFLMAKKLGSEFKDTKFFVVDTEKSGIMNFEMAKKLAYFLNGIHYKLEDLKAENLLNITGKELL